MCIKQLIGKTLVSCENKDNEEIIFKTTEGDSYRLFHYQDCCESVYIESIVGDLEDLVGSEILSASEESQDDKDADESGTWTFYKFSTLKGYVDIRWHGLSNGYYSESVDFKKIE